MNTFAHRSALLAGVLLVLPLVADAGDKLTEPVDVTVINPVLPVEVLNANPIPVSVTSEPSQATYAYTSGTTCTFANVCTATYPAVPAGKRLHVTFVAGFVQTATVGDGLAALHYDNESAFTLRYMTHLNGAQLAYYGASLSFGERIDVVFEPGEAPVLEVGNASSISNSPFNKLTITGYLVDASP